MNTKRKSRANNSTREELKTRPNNTFESGSPRSRQSERITIEGVYNNDYFVNSVACLVGNTVKIHTATGCVFEGIFRAFSSTFEIAIEKAHKVDLNNPLSICLESLVDTMVFKSQDIMKMEFVDTDLEYATTRDTFQTDTAISKFNGQVTEKELEPWDGSAGSGALNDDFELEGATANGWDVIEMFRQNEQMYGVTSNFDHGLSAYTTPLQNKDSKEFKDAEAKAAKIAYEIENNPHYKHRADLENGDEEEKYAAVARPNSENSSSDGPNKYVCPGRRKSLHPLKVGRTPSNVPGSQSQQQGPPPQQTQQAPPPSQPQVPLPVAQPQPQPQQPPPPVAQTQPPPQSQQPPPQPQQTQQPPQQQPTLTQSQPQAQLQSQPQPTHQPLPAHQVQPPHQQQQTQSHSSQPTIRDAVMGVKVTSNAQSNYSHHGPQNHSHSHSHSHSHNHNHSHSHNNMRDRVNGVMEPPKPQRTTSGARHGRSFNNSENNRYSNGNMSGPGNNNSNSQLDNRNSNMHHSHSNYNSSMGSGNDSHSKKPPLPGNHDHGPNHSSNVNQRKTSRGREEQLGDLKKFGNDFKLQNDSDESKKNDNEQSVNNRQPETIQEHPNMRQMNSNIPENPVKVIKSKLNPNAKEFNPNAKPFTPTGFQRTASTPNQSRPHTPQTPGYGPGSVQSMPPAVVMSTYVVAAQGPFSQPPNQPNRFRKVVGQPSQMQVAAATGQPLLTTAPMHTQFAVPYSPQPHINPPPFQQMVRMVAQQSGGMVPPVITAINYPPDGASQAQMQYMGPGSMGPHSHHAHHPPHVHPPNNGSSPQTSNNNNQSSGGGGGGNAVNGSGVPPQYPPSPAPSYSQPPPPPPPQGPGGPHPQNPPPHHSFPIMCPILPPHHPSHNPHHMIAAAAQSSVQQYIHHHPHQHTTSGNLYTSNNQMNNVVLCNTGNLPFM